jgi:hypothetical protein
VDRILRDLGDLPLEQVTPEALERWKRKLTVSNRTVAKYLVILLTSPTWRTRSAMACACKRIAADIAGDGDTGGCPVFCV